MNVLKPLIADKRVALGLTVGIILATFWLDTITPLGNDVWLLYGLAIIPATLWATPGQTWTISLSCMALLAVGLYLVRPDPIQRVYFERIRTTRFLAVIIVSLITMVCVRQIRTSAALRESLERERLERERIKTVMDRAGAGILVVDKAGVIQMHNDVLQTMFGYVAGEADGKNMEVLIPDSLRFSHAALLENYMQEPNPRRLAGGRELQAVRKDGTTFHAEIAVSPMNFKGQTYAIASIRDLTEKKQHESMIARQNRQLKALREIDIAIIGSLDLRLTAQTVLKELESNHEVDAAALLIYNRPDMTLDFLTGIGLRTEALRHTHMRVSEGYAGKAALTKEKIFIADLRESSGVYVRSHHLREEGFVSYMAIPLIAKGRVMGVLELFRRDALDPTKEWDGFLDALAGQTAIAIDNAEIYGELEVANTGLRLAYDQTLEGWVHALDIRDEETEGHSRRVTDLTMRLARMAEIPLDELIHIRRGALLHDIGKLGIPDSVLLKPGKLTEEEWVVMRKHPVYAFEWLSPIQYLKPAMEIPYCHHEKWDGTGYPRGLKGSIIPLAARLFAVVDVWDALRSDRPYRKAWPREKVLEHIAGLAGTHFDPAAVELFMKMEV